MELIPFARQARRACPGHAELVLALGAEFRPPHPGAERAFDHLAAPLLGCEGDPPGEQLVWCAEVVAARLTSASLDWSGIDDLLLDRVVVAGAGHPLALALVCVEAARRAGIELGVVAGGAGCFVAHPRLDAPLLLDVARGRLVDAGGPDDVGWQCAHQVAARILNRIGERARATGNVAWARRAAELRLALPFARPVRDELVHALAHLRSRLN
jgi:hypothetical protein